MCLGEYLDLRGRIRGLNKICMLRCFIVYNLQQVFLGLPNQVYKMGRAYNTHGRTERCVQNFSRKT
jgi:hypothetical protein